MKKAPIDFSLWNTMTLVLKMSWLICLYPKCWYFSFSELSYIRVRSPIGPFIIILSIETNCTWASIWTSYLLEEPKWWFCHGLRTYSGSLALFTYVGEFSCYELGFRNTRNPTGLIFIIFIYDNFSWLGLNGLDLRAKRSFTVKLNFLSCRSAFKASML